MGNFYGADASQLRNWAGTVNSRADAAAELGDSLSSMIHHLGWAGEDATSFRTEATTVLRTLRTGVLARLREFAEESVDHADEQDRASTADARASSGDVPSAAARDQDGALPARAFGHSAPIGTPIIGKGAESLAGSDAPSAAERDTTDPLDRYLPAHANPHNRRTGSIPFHDHEYSVFGALERETRYGGPISSTGALDLSSRGRLEYHSEQTSDVYTTPDGSTVLALRTTIQHAFTKEYGLSHVAQRTIGGSAGVGGHQTYTTTQEVTFPPGATIPEDFDVLDPSSWPPGTRVRWDDSAGVGAHGEISASVPLWTVFGADGGINSSTTDHSVTSTVVESLGDDQVRVIHGPSSGFVETQGYSVGANILGVIGVRHSWEDSDFSHDYTFTDATYDLEEPGIGSTITQQIANDELPPVGTAGVSDQRHTRVELSWQEDDSGFDFWADLGSFGGELAGPDTGGERSNLQATITEEHLVDGSIRRTDIESPDPASGVYAAQETLIEPGASERPPITLSREGLQEYYDSSYVTDSETQVSRYVGVRADSPETAAALTDAYGVPIEEGQVAHIHISDEELAALDAGERQILAENPPRLLSLADRIVYREAIRTHEMPSHQVLPQVVRSANRTAENLPFGGDLPTLVTLARLHEAHSRGTGQDVPPGELRVHGE